jgi:hypothetical protein
MLPKFQDPIFGLATLPGRGEMLANFQILVFWHRYAACLSETARTGKSTPPEEGEMLPNFQIWFR